jgi:putative Mg2+ transporter-C (MgtC) family protein
MPIMEGWLTSFFEEYREHLEMLLRLVVATASGMVIGLNRDLQDKPIGMRTLGIVSLGSAMVVLSGTAYGGLYYEQDAVSRVIQGILTGLGFLGAGVIIRDESKGVRGLTTASTVWVAAALGVTAGLGAWFITIVGNAIALTLLVFGRALEGCLESLFKRKAAEERDSSEAEPQRQNGDQGHQKP